MALNLSKGERISLEKTGGPGLARVVLGLGWGKRKKKGFFGSSEVEVDLDRATRPSVATGLGFLDHMIEQLG